MNRDYTLLSVIEKFGTVPGKKALHKIIYFTNLQTNDFVFRWNNYGPYSDEVQQFYDDAFLDNIISIKEEPLNNIAIQYNMSLEHRGKKLLNEFSKDSNINHEKINKAIDFSYNFLHGMTPRQMEILASVHYITSYDSNLDDDQIWKIIDKLKPKSNFTLQEVEDALTILCKNHLIKD